MSPHHSSRKFILLVLLGALAGCADNPRAVLLPLEYPDGKPVRATNGQPVMAGYQTYGSTLHANATALYERAAPAGCLRCAQLGAVVSEPSVLRQATGLLGASTVGAGAVMGGLGMLEYGQAADAGRLGTNISQNSSVAQNASNSVSRDENYYNKDYWHRGWGQGDMGGGMGGW